MEARLRDAHRDIPRAGLVERPAAAVVEELEPLRMLLAILPPPRAKRMAPVHRVGRALPVPAEEDGLRLAVGLEPLLGEALGDRLAGDDPRARPAHEEVRLELQVEVADDDGVGGGRMDPAVARPHPDDADLALQKLIDAPERACAGVLLERIAIGVIADDEEPAACGAHDGGLLIEGVQRNACRLGLRQVADQHARGRLGRSRGHAEDREVDACRLRDVQDELFGRVLLDRRGLVGDDHDRARLAVDDQRHLGGGARAEGQQQDQHQQMTELHGYHILSR